jgi:hypothetical protein
MQYDEANYVVHCDGNIEACPLKVPSGYQTGIKLVHPFDILAEVPTELILDFSAEESVHVAGKSGKCMLKPTIKVLGTWGLVSGVVKDAGTDDNLENAIVTAQTYEQGGDEGDDVTLYSKTTTGPDGTYAMYLEPNGTYCIVAYKPNEGLGVDFPAYGPECQTVTPTINGDDVLDFALVGSDAGNLLVSIAIPIGNEVTVSARNDGCHAVTCDQIEVWGDTFTADSSPYTVTIGLPELSGDDYHVVVSDSSPTQTEDANPTAYTETIIGPFDMTQ